MAVAGFEIRINGGVYDDTVIDIGFPSPVDGFVPYDVAPLVADTDYIFEARAYDAWGNYADWGTPYPYTTPAVSIPWTDYIDPDWDLGIDASLSSNTSNFQPYFPFVVPKLTTIGDYWEFVITGVGLEAYTIIQVEDESANVVRFLTTGQVNVNGGATFGFTARASGDTARIEKTGANQISYSINGGSLVPVVATLTGDLTAGVDAQTVDNIVIAAPVTNVPY